MRRKSQGIVNTCHTGSRRFSHRLSEFLCLLSASLLRRHCMQVRVEGGALVHIMDRVCRTVITCGRELLWWYSVRDRTLCCNESW